MLSIDRLSLRSKTILIAAISSMLVLLIATSITLYYQQANQTEKAKEEINVLAQILADRSTAALQFEDGQLAYQHLTAAAQRSSIEAACLYDKNGKLFAYYARNVGSTHCGDSLHTLKLHDNNDEIFTARSVMLDGVSIGALYLHASLRDIKHLLWLQAALNVVSAVLAFAIALLLATRLQATVIRPIDMLKKATRDIGDTNNYSLRATKTSQDELGELTDSFNSMLEQIESNNHALQESEARFRLLTTSLPVGVFQIDADGQLVFVNDQWREISGILKDPPTLHDWARNLHPMDRQRVVTGWKDALAQRIECRQEFRLIGRQNRVRHVINQAKPLFVDANTFEGYLGSMLDITELKQVQEQLKQLALFDPLTQLANRHLFRNRLVKALQLQRRTHEKFAVLFLDVDHFKRINDTLGHDQGDALLCAMAARLQACTRPTDTVARLGGDEFILLISGLHINQEADQVARKILLALKTPIELAGESITISTSIGISIAPDDAEDANTLMKYADMAMYRAKMLGRNNHQFFSKEMNEELARQMRAEEDLRQALKNGEFELYFQPQVSMQSKQIVGYEALLRRIHPQHGVIAAEHFIRIAEDSGLIVPIGEWVIETACRCISEMNAQGLLPKDGHVSINLSARQFRDPRLIDIIRQNLEASRIDPSQLELEITENFLLDTTGTPLEMLQKLHDMGTFLTIDDFGTGYSSLNYLKRLPIRGIKVDKSFVSDVVHDEDDREITAAVIAMAHKLGLRVVAEGVENASQAEFLSKNDCDLVQGYFYAKPMRMRDLHVTPSVLH